MSQILKKFIGDNEVGAEKIRLENDASLKARNNANDNDVEILKVNTDDDIIVQKTLLPDSSSVHLGKQDQVFFQAYVAEMYDEDGQALNLKGNIGRSLLSVSGSLVVGFEKEELKAPLKFVDTNEETYLTPADRSLHDENSEEILRFSEEALDQSDAWGSPLSGILLNAQHPSVPTSSGMVLFVKSENDCSVVMGTGDATDVTTSTAGIFTGQANGASNNSGGLFFYSGNSVNAASGSFFMNTGNAETDSGGFQISTGTAGNNSGDILLATGTAGGTRGKIRLADGTAQVGYVWTATNTDGTGEWQAVSGAGAPTFAKQTFTLAAGDITNQYIDLAVEAAVNSIQFLVKGAGVVLEGASHEYTVSYTGGSGGVTRITFANDLATAGAAALVAGDVIQIQYVEA